MKKLKKFVTCDERKKAKEKILETIDNQFKNTAITDLFIKTLLKEVISDLESKASN